MRKLCLLLCSLLLVQFGNAQMFDELKPEKDVNDSKFQLSAGLGIGLPVYTYQTNVRFDINDPATYGVLSREFLFGLSFPVEVNFLYNLEKVRLGAGLKWAVLSLSAKTFSLLQPHLRLEIPVSAGAKWAYTVPVSGGAAIPLGGIGENPRMGGWGASGLLMTREISQKLSFLLEEEVEVGSLRSLINDQNSRHLYYSFSIKLGLRFGL